MPSLDPTEDYSELAELALEELGEGTFTKATILSSIHKASSQYWWARFRRGCSQYGISLKELGACSGQWEIKADTGVAGAAGVLEESQDLHDRWHLNLSGDVQALLDNVEDPETTMLRAVDRGYDPYKFLYLAAANGASENSIQRMAEILAEVQDNVQLEMTERHNRIMGLLTTGN